MPNIKDLSNEELLQLSKRKKNITALSDEELLKLREPSFIKKYGERFIRPTLQMTGAALGGLGGAVAGPAGSIAGGAGGYYTGDQLYRLLKEYTQGGESKGLTGELKHAGKMLGEGAMMEMGGQALGNVAGKAAKQVMPTLKRLSKPVWNVPKEALETYMKKPEFVNKAINQTPFDAGQEMLSKLNAAKNIRVSELTQKQKNILANKNKTVDIKGILNTLSKYEKSISGYTPKASKVKKELATQVDLLKSKLQRGNMIKTKIPVSEANELKRQLQKEALYEEGPVKFYRNDEAGKAYKEAASKLRTEIEKVVPEVKDVNKNLKDILDFETNPKFRNALKPSNIESTMKNVQSKTGNKTYLQNLLKDADKALGTRMGDATEGQFAAKYFRDPDSLSGYVTGRSIGGMPGIAVGTAAGGAIASPRVLKAVAPKAQEFQSLLELLSKTAPAKTTYKTLPYMIGREKETR